MIDYKFATEVSCSLTIEKNQNPLVLHRITSAASLNSFEIGVLQDTSLLDFWEHCEPKNPQPVSYEYALICVFEVKVQDVPTEKVSWKENKTTIDFTYTFRERFFI